MQFPATLRRQTKEVSEETPPTPTARRSSRDKMVRLGLVVLGAGALVYAASRRMGVDVSSVSEVHEKAADVSEEWREVPLEEVMEETNVTAVTDELGVTDVITDEEESDETPAEDDDGDSSEQRLEESVDDERSSDELENMGESDIQEEPASPGEMTVDEDVVDGLVDEETEE